MPTRYEKAPAELVEMMNRVMKQFHSRLSGIEIKIDLLLAFGPTDDNGDLDGPAIKVGGHAALACVRVVNLRDRTKGMGDAEIQVDGDQWDTWSERETMALLDHELTHLEPQLNTKTNEVKRDDLDRPKLTMRLHDRQFGWFDEVARRWGADAWEAKQAREIVSDWKFTQLYLPNFDPLIEFGRVEPTFEDKSEFLEEVESELKKVNALATV